MNKCFCLFPLVTQWLIVTYFPVNCISGSVCLENKCVYGRSSRSKFPSNQNMSLLWFEGIGEPQLNAISSNNYIIVRTNDLFAIPDSIALLNESALCGLTGWGVWRTVQCAAGELLLTHQKNKHSTCLWLSWPSLILFSWAHRRGVNVPSKWL